MKTIKYIERHLYAPELNTIVFSDGTSIRASGVTTIEQAEKYIMEK